MRLTEEEQHQAQFVEWLNLQGIKHTCIPNSTYTTSWSQKRKNKVMGLNAGFPDLVLYLNENQSCTDGPCIVFIEMKRPRKTLKNGKLSRTNLVKENQREWLYCLDSVDNVAAHVCYGYDEAVEIVESYKKY